MKIRAVRAITVDMPMARPIVMGPIRHESREYVIVEVTTDEGLSGRITFHFTPTSASWMNQVETWFGILTRQAIGRGSFRSVKELIAMIDAFTRQWNDGSSLFT